MRDAAPAAPRLAVVHHAAVAALLKSYDADLVGLAAHTLACLGPESVADHYEEIIAVADASLSLECRKTYRLGARAIPEAAWQAISVLEPQHLLRLEFAGAPSLLSLVDRILLPREIIRSDHVANLVNRMLAAQQECSVPPQLDTAGGQIVTDRPSMLNSFLPTPCLTWTPETHSRFPAPARARAVELLLIGELLS